MSSTFRQGLLGMLAAVALVASVSPACAARSISRIDPARIGELTAVSAATRGDVIAAVAAMVLGRGASRDDGALIKKLVALDIVRPKEATNLRAAATRGYACLLFKRALGESGGVWTTLIPNSEHYAYQHLAHLRLIPDGGSWVSITGPELLTLLAKSKRYRREAK